MFQAMSLGGTLTIEAEHRRSIAPWRGVERWGGLCLLT